MPMATRTANGRQTPGAPGDTSVNSDLEDPRTPGGEVGAAVTHDDLQQVRIDGYRAKPLLCRPV
jgi:hypothetical protein